MRKTIVSILLTAMLTASMQAAGHDRSGHTYTRVGVSFGVPLYWGSSWRGGYNSWWGGYNPGYYYSPPVVFRPPLVYYDQYGNPVPNIVLMPGEPLVYYDRYGSPALPVQPQAQQTQPQPQRDAPAPTWFFCADSQAYYPYVQNCASAWQRVIPHPPPQ